MHTEDEARAKWCPFARVMNANGEGGGNRWDNTVPDADVPNGALCAASACMAWRWADRYPPQFSADDTGYCGQAGKP